MMKNPATLTGMANIVMILVAAMLAIVVAEAQKSNGDVNGALYKDPTAPVDERVTDLVARMTLDEKIGQLILPFGAHYPEDYVGYNKTGLGATYPFGSLPNMTSYETRNQWQKWQVESRLGIPTSFIGETLHSGTSGGTIFPMESLQGCTWDKDLVESIGSIIALEARTCGTDRGFSPVLHFCTDPRFGRCEEAFGEDPQLIGTLGVAALTGLSGPGKAGDASEYLANPTTKIATEAKHFAAYGYGGRDGSMPAEISDYLLYDVYLKPWFMYAQNGGRGIMAAHNEVNGYPCHGNHELLTQALREDFGFAGGLCASDAGDINSITGFHIVPNGTYAAAFALNAGMDQELQHNGVMPLVPEALAMGILNQSTVDRAVGNVLRLKIASGLLDGREDLLYVNGTACDNIIDLPEHRAVALRAAQEGTVLLKNDYKDDLKRHILPLVGLGSTIKNIAVIGPNADNSHSTEGGYTAAGAHTVTILEGAVTAANNSGNAFTVRYEKGACLGATPDCPCPQFTPPAPPCGTESLEWIPAAVDLAKQSDITILVIGDSSTILAGDSKAHEETGTCGEHFDRDNLDPPAAQLPLLEAMVAATDNLIVVLIHGRTVTFGPGNELFTNSSSVVSMWRPGEEAGHAFWSIANGTVNPSGRTAHTWPRTVGMVHQYVPWFTPWRTRGTSALYADMAPATPLVPFGSGLSYANYTIKSAELSAGTVKPDGTFNVSGVLTSEGAAGKCVVQIYFSQNLASRVRYQQMLLGYGKFEVPTNSPGTPFNIQLSVAEMGMWNKQQRKYVVEPGVFTIYVSLSSTDHHFSHGITVSE